MFTTGEPLITQGIVSKFHVFVQNNNWYFCIFSSNALLVTAVHVKMKLGDNTLNNERLSLVMKKFPIKKLENCKPYFTALQYINNLKTIKSYKRKVNL